MQRTAPLTSSSRFDWRLVPPATETFVRNARHIPSRRTYVPGAVVFQKKFPRGLALRHAHVQQGARVVRSQRRVHLAVL